MTGTIGAPAELFPAVLYCWRTWALEQDDPRPTRITAAAADSELSALLDKAVVERRRRPGRALRLPWLPDALDFREDDGPRYTVRLQPGELTSWPEPPQRRLG